MDERPEKRRTEVSSLARAAVARKTFAFDETCRRLPEIARTRYFGFMCSYGKRNHFPSATSSTHNGSAPAHASWAYTRSRYRPHITSSTMVVLPFFTREPRLAAI